MADPKLEDWMQFCDGLGQRASVIFDPHTHGPTTLNTDREGLRSLGEEVQAIEDAGEQLVDEINVISVWSFGVALYALQNPTPENIERALELIGVSGDCEERIDWDTLRPLSAPEPPTWEGS